MMNSSSIRPPSASKRSSNMNISEQTAAPQQTRESRFSKVTGAAGSMIMNGSGSRREIGHVHEVKVLAENVIPIKGEESKNENPF